MTDTFLNEILIYMTDELFKVQWLSFWDTWISMTVEAWKRPIPCTVKDPEHESFRCVVLTHLIDQSALYNWCSQYNAFQTIFWADLNDVKTHASKGISKTWPVAMCCRHLNRSLKEPLPCLPWYIETVGLWDRVNLTFSNSMILLAMVTWTAVKHASGCH